MRKKPEKTVSNIWEEDPNFVYTKKPVSSKNLTVDKKINTEVEKKPEIKTMNKTTYKKIIQTSVKTQKKPVLRNYKQSGKIEMFKELRNKIERKNKELALKNKEISEIKKQLQQISNDAIGIKKNFDKRKDNVDGLKKIIKKQEDDIEFLNRQVDTKDQLIRHLTSVVEKKNDEILLLNKKADSGFEKDKPSLKNDTGNVSVMRSKTGQMNLSNDIDWVTQDLMNEKSVKLSEDERMFRLLNMIYPEDVSDIELVKKELGVSDSELKNLVNSMVSKGFLRFTDENEAEITPTGINYVTSH